MSIASDHTALFSPYTWNQGYDEWPSPNPVILTYPFADHLNDYTWGVNTEDPAYFRPLTSSEQKMYRDALDVWASVSGVTFIEAAPSYGDLEVGVYDLDSSTAGQGALPPYSFFQGSEGPELFAYSPTTSGGKIFLDKDHGLNMHVMLHEIGHALGLKHPFDEYENFPTLDKSLDSTSNTVMSYDGARPGRLGELDIAAIQAIYGAPSDKGSNVSSWSWDQNTSTLHQIALPTSDNLFGTAANDIIDARPGGSLVYTRDGDDTILISGTNFQVSGGEGFDQVIVDFHWSDVFHRQVNGEHRFLWTDDGGQMSFFGVERVVFSEGTLAFDLDGNAGQAYRVYKAAFARTPDNDGLKFWIESMDSGASLLNVAAGFTNSTEFTQLYGSGVGSVDFVNQLYINILGRNGEPDGINFWSDQINSGSADMAMVLAGLSESTENINNTASVINEGIWYA